MKIIKRTLGVLLITVLASTLSVLTTGIVVNAYIQSVLSSFDIKLDAPASGISGIIKSLTGNKSAKVEKKDSGQVDSDSANTGTKDESTTKSVDENVPEDALPVMGQNVQDQQLVMTPEAMSDLKNNLPSGEKVDIFNILMTKVPTDEMQKISKAMEDGLTDSEVKEIQEVISKYVDKEEYDDLMKMLTPTSTTSP